MHPKKNLKPLVLVLLALLTFAQTMPAQQAAQGQQAAPAQEKTAKRTSGVVVKPRRPVVVQMPEPAATYSPAPAEQPGDGKKAAPAPSPAPSPTATPTPSPSPSPTPAEEVASNKAEEEAARKAAEEARLKAAAEAKLKEEREAKEREAKEAKERAESEARKRAEDERLAGQAALQREREQAAADAREAARLEMEKRLADEKKAGDERVADEKKAREELERKAAEELKKLEKEAKARLDAEAKIEEERKAREAGEAAAKEREAKLEQQRLDADSRLDAAQKEQKRKDDIISLARQLNFRDPAAAVALVPADVKDYRASLEAAAKRDVTLVRPVTATTGTFCDPDFVGGPLLWDYPEETTTLGSVIGYIRTNYHVNIMPDSDVMDIPVTVNVTNVPWNIVLRNLLDYKDLEATCSVGGVLNIVARAKMATIQDNRRKSAPLVEEFIALKYLQATPQVTVNVAGKSSNPSAGAYQTLEETINRLLKESGNTSAQVARVPNRNELFIRAPADTMASIKRLIAKADRESYVVVLRASTYSADESRLKALGLQTAITLSDAAGFNLGGLSTLPQNGGSQSGGAAQQPKPGLNPGGVPGLPSGFQQPTNALGTVSPSMVLGGSGLFGTVQFAVQLTALQQNGVVNVQQRPALLVNNGDTGTLDFGRTIAVAVQALGTGNVATGQLELLNGGSSFAVTPYVAEDENGNPAFVTLDVRLENNDVDTSVSTATAPSIIRRAIQTRYVMGNKQTVVFSAFSTDTTTRQRDKTPFLGDLPGIGGLFRRRLDQISRSRTYFTLSVEIVRQSEIINVATPPSDASPEPVPPPDPPRPSVYDKKKN
jgi:Flp pilus assembly secretin CpaC